MPRDATLRDVKANGVRLRLSEQGAGPPVVLLHGLFMDHRTWDGVAADLSREFHLIAPDFPGFGESEKPSPGKFRYDVEALSSVVADLYAGLALGRAAIVGHGLGGAVALTLAARHPELVSRLVLVGPTCFDAPIDPLRRAALLPVLGGFVLKQLWGRTAFRAFFRNVVLSGRAAVPQERIDAYYDAFNDPAARGSAHATLRATADARAVAALTARVASPTLVVWGRADRVVPARLGRELARRIRGSGFELMDAGHAPQEEHPGELAGIVARFLRAERPAGA